MPAYSRKGDWFACVRHAASVGRELCIVPEYAQLPSDDPTSYTVEELRTFIQETWARKQSLKKNGADPVELANLEIKIKVCRSELKERSKHKIQENSKPGQEELWPDLIPMKEFLEKPTDPARWIWEDCLPVGSSSLLVAAPKTGKTHLAVNLCLAIARGWPFLGRGVQQGRAAYVFLDGHYEELREVFQQFAVKPEDDILIYSGSARGDPVGWAIKQIQKFNVRFLVLDTLQKVFRFKNINDYSEVTNAMEPLNEAQQEYGTCVLYLHHAGKPNQFRGDLDSAVGSTVLRGNCYSFLHMKRLTDQNPSPRILRSDQRGGRNFEEIRITDGSDGFMEKQGTIVDAWMDLKKPEILEFVKETSGCQEKEILLAVEGRRKIVVGAIRALLKNNEIERTGKGGRGDPFKYYLAGCLVSENEAEVLVPDLFAVQKGLRP